jgi:hypothetical protein
MRELMSAEQIDTDRPRWKEIRRKGITATDIPGIMAIEGARKRAHAIYWNKVAGDEIPDSWALERGRILEPRVAEAVGRTYPELDGLQPGPLASHGRRRWQMCTFDLLGAGASVEIKTVGGWRGATAATSWGDAPHGDIPPAILAQCVWQGDIARRAVVILAALNWATGELRFYLIDMADAEVQADLEVMRGEGLAFRERIKSLRPPRASWHPSSRDALVRVYAGAIPEAVQLPDELRDELQATKRGLVAAQHAYDQAANDVRAQLRTATHALDSAGHVFAQRSVYTPRRLSHDLVRQRDPELAAACTTDGSPIDKLLVKGYEDDDT